MRGQEEGRKEESRGEEGRGEEKREDRRRGGKSRVYESQKTEGTGRPERMGQSLPRPPSHPITSRSPKMVAMEKNEA